MEMLCNSVQRVYEECPEVFHKTIDVQKLKIPAGRLVLPLNFKEN